MKVLNVFATLLLICFIALFFVACQTDDDDDNDESVDDDDDDNDDDDDDDDDNDNDNDDDITMLEDVLVVTNDDRLVTFYSIDLTDPQSFTKIQGNSGISWDIVYGGKTGSRGTSIVLAPHNTNKSFADFPNLIDCNPIVKVDNNSNIHFVYFGYDPANGLENAVYYATNVTGPWTNTMIADSLEALCFESDLGQGERLDFALDSNGKAHIAFFDPIKRILWYATNVTGTWNLEPVKFSPLLNDSLAISVNSNNDPFILYPIMLIQLQLATKQAGNWSFEMIELNPDPNKFYYSTSPQIEFDSLGCPNVCSIWEGDFYFYDYSTVRCGKKTNGVWEMDQVYLAQDNSTQRIIKLLIDYSDNLHMFSTQDFYWSTNGDFNYHSNQSGSWSFRSLNGYAKKLDAKLDLNGLFHLSYHDENLKYLQYISGVENQYILDETNGVLGYDRPPIAMDLQGAIYTVILNDQGELLYLTNKGGAWSSELIVNVDKNSDEVFSSLVLDSNGNPHVFYSEGRLQHATNGSGSWISETVDSYYYVTTSALAIDQNDKLHGTFYSGSAMRYVTNESGSWMTEPIEVCLAGRNSDIEIDSNGLVHVLYSVKKSLDRNIAHATKISGNWVVEVPFPLAERADQVSLDLDSNNAAHVSYFDESTYELVYMTNASGSWQRTIVEPISPGSGYDWQTRLIVDDQNHPHIAYYNTEVYGLKYATNHSGTWASRFLDRIGGVGNAPDIAFGPDGLIHVLYNGHFSILHTSFPPGYVD